MAKRNDRADSTTPWEYHAALLPVRFRDKGLSAGTDDRGSNLTSTAEAGQPILAGDAADEAEQRRFLEALLRISWLPPQVRVAVTRTLGRSQRDAKVEFGKGRTMAWQFRVKEVEARLRANGERPPRGGFYAAAVEEVADDIGMKSETLERSIRRLRG